MSLAELKKRNAELKAELAKLEALAAELAQKPAPADAKDAKASAPPAEKKLSDEEIKEVFNVFDADRSGFVDKQEFQAVAGLLGLLLEEKELEAAVKSIDTSGDGQISFDEFLKWFKASEVPSDKPVDPKMAGLIVKIRGHQVTQLTSQLVRQAAARLNKNDDSDMKLAVDVNLMPEQKVKASAHLSFAFGPNNLPQSDGPMTVLQGTLRVADGVEAKAVEDFISSFKELLQMMNLAPTAIHNAEAKTITVRVPMPVDPLMALPMVGIDPQNFIKKFDVNIDLPVTPAELLSSPDIASLADVIGASVRVDAVVRKSFLTALLSLIGHYDILLAGLLSSVEFDFALSLKQLVASFELPVLPEGAPAYQARHLAPIKKPLDFIKANMSIAMLRQQHAQLGPMIAMSAGPAIPVLKKAKAVIQDLVEIQYQFGSVPLAVVYKLNNLIHFPTLIPDLE